MSHIKFNCCAIFLILIVSSIQTNELTKGVSDFASEFYEQCVKSKPGNVIVSPFSMATSLALLSQATSGSTFDELRNGLHLTGDKATIANQFHEYFGQLQRSVGESTLSMANQIYIQQGNKLNKDFQEVAATKFASGVESVNFGDAEKSAEIINHFVEEKTNNKIQNFIKPSFISADTLVFLVNAIYFKSNWEVQFNKNLTNEREFYISETESVPAEFMVSREKFNHAPYLEDLQASALELKYANSNLSFVIVLPFRRTGLTEVEAKMKHFDLNNITDEMRVQKVDVIIPKFKVEYEIELNEVLENLGMVQMFGNDANLNGLLESGDSLKVSKVLHKAFIEINEEGSEAAAGSGTGIVKKRTPPRFRADHPFMYFIRDTETNTTIFSGRVEQVGNN